MEEVFSQSKKFFELPLSEKMKVLRNEKHRGYTPVLDELLDPDNQIHGSFLFLFNSELLPFLLWIYQHKMIFCLFVFGCIVW